MENVFIDSGYIERITTIPSHEEGKISMCLTLKIPTTPNNTFVLNKSIRLKLTINARGLVPSIPCAKCESYSINSFNTTSAQYSPASSIKLHRSSSEETLVPNEECCQCPNDEHSDICRESQHNQQIGENSSS